MKDVVKILDGMTIGCGGSIDVTRVTLEMSRKHGMEFLFALSREFQNVRQEDGPVRDIIGMGQPFYYRGTWFRVVEEIKS